MCDTTENNRNYNIMATEPDDHMTCLVYLSTSRFKTGMNMVIVRISMKEVREWIVKRTLLCKNLVLKDRIQTKCIVACNASMRHSRYLIGQCFIGPKQYKWPGVWSHTECPGTHAGCSATIIWIKGTTRNFPAEIWQLVMDYL